MRALALEAPDRRTFCGYCAQEPPDAVPSATRVCSECGLGLLLTVDEALVPGPDEPFLVVDAGLNVRAVSEAAERAFAIEETDAVEQPLTEVLVAAESSAEARADFSALVAGAARAPLAAGAPPVAFVRPARAFGVRYRARVGRCEPGSAAVVVLSPL